MYQDKNRKRVLLRDGSSVLSSFGYAKNIIEGNDPPENVKVASDFHSEIYDYLNKTNTSVTVEEKTPKPKNHIHSEEDLERLIILLEDAPRFQGTEKEIERIETELDYFEKTNNILFLLYCVDLLEKFRENDVVWGVGRGSSCASYIAYLLEINDVDPLKFDIDFRELSKEY